MPSLDAFGIVCADIAKSVKFYRLLGLEFPDPGDDHIEATAKNGEVLSLPKPWDEQGLGDAGRPAHGARVPV